ncbi:MAG: class F sortase [Dehalococcoidia bacterium]
MHRTALIGCYLFALVATGFVAGGHALGQHSVRATATPYLVGVAVTPTTPPSPSPSPSASPQVLTTLSVTATATETAATPAPVASSRPPAAANYAPSPFAPGRLVIPALGINSGWSGLGFLADGLTMASPVGPRDLGWYSFSGAPGGPSNAIFAGHVDWYTGAPAIFGGLGALGPGSIVQVSRWDGVLVTYHVISSAWYDFLHTDASAIIAPTAVPTVTLITCGGTFNSATHEYDKRLVVRAVAN